MPSRRATSSCAMPEGWRKAARAKPTGTRSAEGVTKRVLRGRPRLVAILRLRLAEDLAHHFPEVPQQLLAVHGLGGGRFPNRSRPFLGRRRCPDALGM